MASNSKIKWMQLLWDLCWFLCYGPPAVWRLWRQGYFSLWGALVIMWHVARLDIDEWGPPE